MPNPDSVSAENETLDATQKDVNRIRALAEWKIKDMPPQIAADTVVQMLGDMASGAIKNNAAQREVLDVYMRRAVQAEQPEPDPGEAEASALLDSFDGRIAEIEQRIDRVLARLSAS